MTGAPGEGTNPNKVGRLQNQQCQQQRRQIWRIEAQEPDHDEFQPASPRCRPLLEQQIERKSADDEEQDHGLMAGPQQPCRRPLRQNVLVAVEAKEADVGNQDDDRSPAPQGIDPEIVLPIGR
jgi:hypothetical protein